jgi:predicted Ser/Thr protein kinase
MGMMDSMKGTKGASGEKMPKGVNASDMSGERKQKLVGGVAMGKMDSMGSRPMSHAGNFEGKLGELNDGNMGERECYSHKRTPHAQDGK